MRVGAAYQVGLTLALLGAGQWTLPAADEAPKPRQAPIVFSTPKSDTVSSNLNQIGTKSSSLRSLESGLTKPFEIFDSSRPVQPPARFAPVTPSTPAVNNRKLKDVLDRRAEESYLLAEDDEPETSRETSREGTRPDRESLDPVTGRRKTSLDRYYDRIDRMRAGVTNQTSRSNGLFGDQDDPDEKDDSKSRRSGSFLDRELSVNARALGRMSNSASASEGGWFSSDRLKPRNSGDLYELGRVEQPAPRTTVRAKDTRLEEFKRLLDGPGYGSRNMDATAPPSSTGYQPPKSSLSAPAPSLNSGLQPAGPSYANTPGFSASTPALPGYAGSAPSVTARPPAPETTQKPPVPSFKIPRGRF
ncbi:MAG TPA: hypothetical protein VFZ59_24065 [Verrucomicrobiae bacterium]|nr:hypothetical protein [Verrucomicrobiae bacterium]